jgi:nucleoside-diphosphate-sugar epimerase
MSGEMYHILYNRVYNIQTSVLRLTNTYGPRMRIRDARQTFLGIWIRNLLENRMIEIYGDGSQIRDYNYIDDVVDAFLLVAGAGQWNGVVFNLGHDHPYSLKETAEIMIGQFRSGGYIFRPFPDFFRKIDIGSFYSDFGKIRSSLGWSPVVGLDEGIRKTIEYFRENLKYYV